MFRVRVFRSAALATAAAAMLLLGVTTPAQAAAASYDCHWVTRAATWCTVKVGVAQYNGGQATLDIFSDGNNGYDARIRLQPANGFTLVLRVFPNEGGGGYIDYRQNDNGRKLSYPIDFMQVWVQGHSGISEVLPVNTY